MPEMFGTHHCKMLILFRHDDSAQVIVHTANMIAKDWTNMTNAAWISPLLPRLPSTAAAPSGTINPPYGSGERFKKDIVSYLRNYDTRGTVCGPLADQLMKYDFSQIRACFIASVPSKRVLGKEGGEFWGWPQLREALKCVPAQDGKAEVAVQVSSIATLGPTDSWLRNTLFHALSTAKNETKLSPPKFKVIFPTADEIRQSLDGYYSGGSIHTKTQSIQQQKQLQYMRPMFCHWANDSSKGMKIPEDAVRRDGGRDRAAPHIKTYIRYGEESIDWALLTSANISKQAWGEAPSAISSIKIASWETGVLIWPDLFAERAKLVGAFQSDTPNLDTCHDGDAIVGLRIPYSLPLQSYSGNEVPWENGKQHLMPDCKGRSWAN
jgi:tyrosyl-DNA phosphodiesterase 1